MPSSPTSRSRFEKQGSGENANTWGAKLNTTGLDLLDEAIDGVETIALTVSPTTLTTTNFASDQQRNKAYRFTGTGSFTVNTQATEWVKLFINAMTGTLTVSNGTNTTTIAAGKSYWIASDGTSLFKDTTAEAAATAAETSANNAATSASNASTSATNSANSATNSANSATNSANSATASANSAANSANSATSSANSATLSSNWAQKTDATVDGTGFSAKYWAQQASAITGIPTLSGNAGKFLTNDGSAMNWAAIATGLTPVAQTASFTIAAADDKKLFDATGMTAAITYTLPAASTVPANFAIGITNRSYKESTIRFVTVALNGTDTIDGLAASLNVYAETVIFRRNAGGTGWITEKDNQVVCWDYTLPAAAAAVEFTTPFSDTQFESYRIEYRVEQGGAATSLLAKLAFGGTLSANHSASGLRIDTAGTVIGFGEASSANLRLSLDDITIAEGIISIANARGSGGGTKGPFVENRHFSANISTVSSGISNSSGALSAVRFLLANGFNFNATATRFRIIGIRKGN